MGERGVRAWPLKKSFFEALKKIPKTVATQLKGGGGGGYGLSGRATAKELFFRLPLFTFSIEVFSSGPVVDSASFSFMIL